MRKWIIIILKKVLSNLKKINIVFSDGKSKINYQEIYKNYLILNQFLIKISYKKVLSVVYNQTGVNFWTNFINSYLSNFTVMP